MSRRVMKPTLRAPAFSLGHGVKLAAASSVAVHVPMMAPRLRAPRADRQMSCHCAKPSPVGIAAIPSSTAGLLLFTFEKHCRRRAASAHSRHSPPPARRQRRGCVPAGQRDSRRMQLPGDHRRGQPDGGLGVIRPSRGTGTTNDRRSTGCCPTSGGHTRAGSCATSTRTSDDLR